VSAEGAGSERATAPSATAEPATALDTSLLFEVFALNQAVGRLLADAMGDGPLSPADYAIYSAVFELEAASPTELSRRLGMRLTTFVDRLREVERRGHARRIEHPTDGRSYLVVLTAEGLAAHRAANLLFERAAAAVAIEVADEREARSALLAIRAAADRARHGLANSPARPRDPIGSGVSPRRSGDPAG
jgi:DNA-binding MarR family transcriptional regulator